MQQQLQYGYQLLSHWTSIHLTEDRESAWRTLRACVCSTVRHLLSSNSLVGGPLTGFGNPSVKTSQRSAQRSGPDRVDHLADLARRSPSRPRLHPQLLASHCGQLRLRFLKAPTKFYRDPLPFNKHGQYALVVTILLPMR